LAKRLRECERTQNTLRALIVAAKVHLRIVINAEQSSPVYLKLNHRLAPMC
jgi:chromosome condensin MukBEF ATPase and DNA-binding subunit MukB